MYSMANIMYGIPLHTNDYNDFDHSEDLENALDNGDNGFYAPYSGAGDTPPAAFGVCLDDFDVACHHIDLSELSIKPTDDQVKEYCKLYDSLTAELQDEIAQWGSPRVFILWSTS